jgi:hypothetical protein
MKPNNIHLIDEEWKDEDGYWIILKQGYILYPEWTSGIREDDKKKAYDRLKDVRKAKEA